MNILHLNEKIANAGGVEVYLIHLRNIMPELGHRFYWLRVKKLPDGYVIEDKDGELVKGGTLNEAKDKLASFIQKNEIDIIHLHSISDPQIVRFCATMKPLVRSMHEPRMFCPGQGKFWHKTETICNKPFGTHCLVRAYTQNCCNRQPRRLIKAYKNTSFEIREGSRLYYKVIAMSDFMKQEAILAGFPANKIEVNPYFTPEQNDVDSDMISPSGEKRLFFAGRLSRVKGVHFMLDAVIPLLEQDDNLFLDIVGDGMDAQSYKNKVPATLKKQVVFHGWKSPEQVAEIMAKSYLVLFPSIYPEAFGIVGIEAMMKAKPVVGFDVGGVSSWLENEETGILVKVKDVTGFQNAVQSLLQDSEQYHEMASQARKSAYRKFIPMVHIKKLLSTYKGAIGDS